MAQPTFTETDSMKVIQEMIANAKKEVRNDRFFYLIWGWLTFAASFAHFALLYTDFQYPYAVWAIMIIGAIGTVLRVRKLQRKSRVKTFVDRFISNIWIAVSAGIFISLISAATLTGYSIAYPYLILLFGIGTYMSGVLFRFKPLRIGGVLNWIIALAAFYVSFQIQLLLLALAVVVSYLIPGYLIRE